MRQTYVHIQRARILYTQAIWITDEKNEKKHLSGLYECLYTCAVRVCLDKCVYVWVYACRSMTVWQL